MNKYFLFLLFTVFTIGCTHQSATFDMDAEEARTIMEDVSKRNRNYEPLTERDDTMMQRVVAYYKECGTSNDLMEAYYLLGSVYRDLHEAPKAIEAFLNGISVADTLDENCRYDILARLYGQKSDLLYRQNLYEQSAKEEANLYKYALKGKDTLMAVSAQWERLGKCYVMCDYQTIVNESWTLLEESQRLGQFQYAAQKLCTSALAEIKLGKINDARKFLDIYEQHSGDVDLRTMESSFPIYYYAKGRLLAAEYKMDSAEMFFRREMKETDWNNRQAAYRGLHEVFRLMEKKDSVIKYCVLQCDAVDSAYQEKLSENLQNLHELYDYSRAQRESYEKSLQLEEKQRNLQRIWMGIGLTCIIVLFAFYYFYAQFKKRIVMAELELERANVQLNIKEHTLDILNEQLQHASGEVERTMLNDQLKQAEKETERQELVVKERQEELRRLRKWTQGQAKDIRMHYQGEDLFLSLLEKVKDNKVAMPEDYKQVEARLLCDDARLIRRFYKIVPDISETDRNTFLLMRFGMNKSETSSLMAHEKSASSKACDRMFERAMGRKPSNRAEAYKWLLDL